MKDLLILPPSCIILFLVVFHVFPRMVILAIFVLFQLNKAYTVRDTAIKKCIEEVSVRVKDLNMQKNNDPDNFEVLRNLRKEQTSVRVDSL